MRKSVLIARSNLRLARGQAAAIVVLILLAAMMLNLWLMLALDYKANFDRCHDRLNDGHVTMAVDGDTPELRGFLAGALERDGRAAQFRLDSCLYMVANFAYNGGELNSQMIFLDKDTALSRGIGRAEIVEDVGGSGIYLPMLYKTDEIDVGKSFELSIGSNPVTYTVCGFFNSAMMGSHNCAMMEIILTGDKYEELEVLAVWLTALFLTCLGMRRPFGAWRGAYRLCAAAGILPLALCVAAVLQPLGPVGVQLVQQNLQRSPLLRCQGAEQLCPAAQDMRLVTLGHPGPAPLGDGQGHLAPVLLASDPGNEPLILQFGSDLAHRSRLDAQQVLELLLGHLPPLA